MLFELKNKSKVIGVKQSLKAVKAGEARRVYFAAEIETVAAESMAMLGQACDIDVGAAVVVLLKEDSGK